ncbi:MAG TPA: hypothetical protein VL094_10550 [Sphingomonadaceae bacterium]|nr:hypothetical protein [Sphingomonadaceae bacterium]
MIGLDHLARVAKRMRAVHETWLTGTDEQHHRNDAGNSAISIWENEGGRIVDPPQGCLPGHASAQSSCTSQWEQEAEATTIRSDDWGRISQLRGQRS